MKILYDHQIFSWQHVGGISRYFSELQNHLSDLNNVEVINSITFTSNLYLTMRHHKGIHLISNFYLPGKVPLLKLINRFYSVLKLKTSSFDVFHPTYYDDYFLQYLGQKPYVVTVYDMIHELFPQDFPGDTTSSNKLSVVKKASHIIAISQSTKNDIVKLFKLDPKHITVIPLASSLNPNSARRITLPKSYLLYVGDRGKYKNFSLLIKIAPQIFDLNGDLNVVCVGGGSFNQPELQLMGAYSSRFKQYDLGDEELVYAYQHAECLIIPSLYEGFGLPLVEAMQCGCPVISSNTSSLPEVGGDAALYFDPHNPTSMLQPIKRLISNRKLRDIHIKRGYLRSKKFSWNQVAKQTLSVYRRI
jgi:glycosyltransferase involved in cell wall biosynthesis